MLKINIKESLLGVSNSKYYYQLMLLLVSVIWGSTFSFQKNAAASLDPFIFNSLRFFLGACFMLFLILIQKKSHLLINIAGIKHGLFLGVFLFLGNAFQQIGLEYTTASNSGFITSLYILIVPLFLYFRGHKLTLRDIFPILMAILGLYLLSGANAKQTQFGDLLQFIGAFFWAGHIIYISGIIDKNPALILNFWQVSFCGLISWITSLVLQEAWSLQIITEQIIPISYAGIISMGIALSLQIVAQKHVSPTVTVTILSLEGLFAAFFGAIMLGEQLSLINKIGGVIISTAVIISQLYYPKKNKAKQDTA